MFIVRDDLVLPDQFMSTAVYKLLSPLEAVAERRKRRRRTLDIFASSHLRKYHLAVFTYITENIVFNAAHKFDLLRISRL